MEVKEKEVEVGKWYRAGDMLSRLYDDAGDELENREFDFHRVRYYGDSDTVWYSNPKTLYGNAIYHEGEWAQVVKRRKK